MINIALQISGEEGYNQVPRTQDLLFRSIEEFQRSKAFLIARRPYFNP